VTDVTDRRPLGEKEMDKTVVERALRALAAIGAVRPMLPEPSREMREPADRASANPVKAESGTSAGAPCGSPHCAGCYDVGDGRKIHPPKCGEEYRKWLERWQPKGKPQ
jgi:hypothetical protein